MLVDTTLEEVVHDSFTIRGGENVPGMLIRSLTLTANAWHESEGGLPTLSTHLHPTSGL